MKEIFDAIVEMPLQLRKLALVYLFQWYAMVCYWQSVSLSIAASVYGVTAARYRVGVHHGRSVHRGGADDPVVPVRRLHGDHQHDDRRAGVLLAIAAAAMTWIKEPPIVRDVDDVRTRPAGAH